MSRGIYDLLNGVYTDASVYEAVELSDLEKQKAKNIVLKNIAVRNSKTNRKFLNWAGKVAAALALVLIITGGTAIANRSVSSTFLKLFNRYRGMELETETVEIFEAFGEYAVPVEDMVVASDEISILSASDSGITIQIKDVYYDGILIFYTAELTSDNINLNRSERIIFLNDEESTSMHTMNQVSDRTSILTKNEDGSFLMTGLVNLKYMEAQSGLELDEKNPIVLEWDFSQVRGYEQENDFVNSNMFSITETVSGNWSLRIPIMVEGLQKQFVPLNLEDNGVLLKEAVISKAGLFLEVEKSRLYDVDSEILFYDENGKQIPFLDFQTVALEHEKSLNYIALLYQGQKEITLKVVAREDNLRILNEISFSIP